MEALTILHSLAGTSMNRYVIRADYVTGDSFGSEDTFEILSPVWTDLDKAKQALKDLTEHHKYYLNSKENCHRWHDDPEVDISDLTKKSWYRPAPEDRGYWTDFWTFSVDVELDDGSKHTVSVQYHGYFEHLNSLEITAEPQSDTDMKAYF